MTGHRSAVVVARSRRVDGVASSRVPHWWECRGDTPTAGGRGKQVGEYAPFSSYVDGHLRAYRNGILSTSDFFGRRTFASGAAIEDPQSKGVLHTSTTKCVRICEGRALACGDQAPPS